MKGLSNGWDIGSKITIVATRSSGSSPAFAACVRRIPKIPALVVDAHGSHFIRRKRNFGVSPDLYNAALAHNNLIETSAVLKFD
jgi:hypothetical protein